jgi:hypothetical protein
MGDNPPTTPVDPAATPPADPKGTTPPATGGEGQPPVDLTKLSESELAKVLEHPGFFNIPRIKELREKAQKAKEYEAEQAKKAEDEAKKKGDYEKLLSDKDAKIADLESQVSTTRLNGAIERAATKAGAVDTETILALVDKSKIKVEDNGTLTGVDEAIKELLEAKPFLKGDGTPPTLGAPSNPGNGATTAKRFTMSQIQDTEFYRANKADIQAAQRAGTIVDDSRK